MSKKLNEILQNIEDYKNENPHYKELLEMLEEILILREEFRRKITHDVFGIEQALVVSKLSGGLPLIDFTAGKFDLEQPKEYFMALLKIAERFHPEETKAVLQEMESGEVDYESMVRDTFIAPPPEPAEAAESADATETDNETEGEQPDDENRGFDLIGFFLEESLRPAMELTAERYASIIPNSGWSEGYCPVCGKDPKIGTLKEEEGRKFLFCNQCGTEWLFRRINCPFCGNEEQKNLSYFTVNSDERYRVDVCDACKRYVKIVDLRNSNKDADLDVEDIATLHLDMLANEEGYH
ncbi:MAG: formate dehydrogenase accessory protein FdhE [Syntrophaceae bacterium]